MPVRDLILYPDARLARPAPPVSAFDDDLRRLAEDLCGTLAAVRAMGLTAPHVGVGARLVAIRPLPDLPPRVYVNPVVVEASEETAVHREGSVSMPGIEAPVERPARIRVRYRDLDGREQEERAEGFAAACHQHEIDQLDGVFWLARLTRLRRERALAKFAKAARVGGRGATP